MEQQDLLFVYFLSIFQLILVLTYAILIVLDRTAWDRHRDVFLPWMSEEWWELKSFFVMTGLCCTVLFLGIPHFLGLEIQLRLSVG